MMRSRRAKNREGFSGLVKKSARLSAEFTYGTTMRPISTSSRLKVVLALDVTTAAVVLRVVARVDCGFIVNREHNLGVAVGRHKAWKNMCRQAGGN